MKEIGLKDQGPSNPDLSVWHRPRAWALHTKASVSSPSSAAQEEAPAPRKRNDLLVVEALAVKDLSEVVIVLVAIWQTTVGCAVLGQAVLSSGSVCMAR